MAIETLGEACSQGWRVTVRCAYGRSEGPRSQSSRECNYRKELDMETLVWTRGRAFPLSRLESRRAARAAGSCYAVVRFFTSRRAAPLIRQDGGDQHRRTAAAARRLLRRPANNQDRTAERLRRVRAGPVSSLPPPNPAHR